MMAGDVNVDLLHRPQRLQAAGHAWVV